MTQHSMEQGRARARKAAYYKRRLERRLVVRWITLLVFHKMEPVDQLGHKHSANTKAPNCAQTGILFQRAQEVSEAFEKPGVAEVL